MSEKCSKMQQTHWNVSIPEDKNNNNNNNNDSEKNSGCHERIFLCIAKVCVYVCVNFFNSEIKFISQVFTF